MSYKRRGTFSRVVSGMIVVAKNYKYETQKVTPVAAVAR